MSEHKLPRDLPPLPPQEGFVINDPDVGKTFAIRECTDEQLSRYLTNSSQAHANLTAQAMRLLGEGVNAAKTAAVLGFELDRRRRSITIAQSIDVSGLRRQ